MNYIEIFIVITIISAAIILYKVFSLKLIHCLCSNFIEKLMSTPHSVINLFTCYYNDKNEERQKELDICVYNNIDNKLITNIFLILDKQDTIIPDKIKNSPKVKLVYVDTRPTFKKIFEIVNDHTGRDDFNIVANTDMYFDEKSLENLSSVMKYDTCLALTRWDVLPDGKINFFNRSDSQDVWIFKGKINKIKNMELDYTQGILGCDNKIAYELKNTGYQIWNPSLDFITYHLHNSNIRNYDENNRVTGNYLFLPTTFIKDIINKA